MAKRKARTKEHNAAISATYAATKERRKGQVCKTYDLKVSMGHLSRKQKETLKLMFLQAKWLRNDCLAHGIDGYEIGETAEVKLPDGTLERRPITTLGSQMRQSVVQELRSNRESLETLDERGHKTGKLKFVRHVNSIDLKQAGVTYRISKERSNRIGVQNLPGTLRVRGLGQLKEGAELANAKLVKAADGYHVMLTCYYDRELVADDYVPGTVAGTDMGLNVALTHSDGREIDVHVPESSRLKGLQKKLARQQEGSVAYGQTRRKIEREYKRLSDAKDDRTNQIVHDLMLNETVFFQDENIRAWKTRDGWVRGGRTVQASALGRVKARLKAHPRAHMLPRYVATTQRCPRCDHLTKHAPGERTFRCSQCGFEDGRDFNAACNMVRYGLESLSPVDRRSTGVERMSDFDGLDLHDNDVIRKLSAEAFRGETRKPLELALG